jgi:hypothetical protein
MKDYPWGSQAKKGSSDIVIPVKLFDNAGTIRWWLAEYDPELKIAFGYVTGFFEDEWGNISIEELEDLELVLDCDGFKEARAIPRIELDEFFEPTKFSDLQFHKESTD